MCTNGNHKMLSSPEAPWRPPALVEALISTGTSSLVHAVPVPASACPTGTSTTSTGSASISFNELSCDSHAASTSSPDATPGKGCEIDKELSTLQDTNGHQSHSETHTTPCSVCMLTVSSDADSTGRTLNVESPPCSLRTKSTMMNTIAMPTRTPMMIPEKVNTHRT